MSPMNAAPASRLAAWLATALAAALGGCAAYPTAGELAATTLAGPAGEAGSGVLDGRSRFRGIFCEIAARDGLVPAGDPRCESLLWRLADEPAASGRTAPLPPVDPALRFFVVTGALSDCFGPDALPYREGIVRLAEAGVTVQTLRVSGRSGASHNAQQIAAQLDEARLRADDHVVLIGYSKGAVDILHFLDDFPQRAAQVVAVVSIGGPLLGSPLAERGAWAYDHLLADAFAGRCDPGDGGLVDSMLPSTRRDWLVAHPPPAHVAYFAVAGFTTREHLARSLRPSWRLLSGADPRNDGQVLVQDAVLPGWTLLGYPNADHWGLALTVERELPHLAARPAGNVLPQGALLEAILRRVSEALAAGGGRP